jgi:hypothetical protein
MQSAADTNTLAPNFRLTISLPASAMVSASQRVAT